MDVLVEIRLKIADNGLSFFLLEASVERNRFSIACRFHFYIILPFLMVLQSYTIVYWVDLGWLKVGNNGERDQLINLILRYYGIC